MAVSGLTCYVLIRAIENDLRALILRFSEDEESAVKTLDPELLKRARDRRAKERRGQDSNHLSTLLPYIDFGDALATLAKVRARFPDDLREELNQAQPYLQAALPIRNRVAHTRPLELDDLPRIVDLAEMLIHVPGFDWPELKRARHTLETNPASVLSVTPDLIKDSDQTISHNLPPADFDETGLLGRRELRQKLGNALKGPWPVISILGEGGIGKTALALQIAYDLLDDPDCPFEAIVWTSAKTEVLTPSEITRIEGAIQDSLGLFAKAAEHLAGAATSADPIAEVLGYLKTFKILLVLDNLETVLDERIHEFLGELPTGCKVLITSRIGVRTQFPFNLGPLSDNEAVRLLRLLTRARHVDALTGLNDEVARDYVRRMNFHPGFIKWFVSGVQVGEAPEQLLSRDKLLLDYCMSNVFNRLSEDAKGLLRSLLVVHGSHTQAELSFLNDFDAKRTQAAVYELLATNFVSQTPAGANRTALALSDFSRKYIQRHHPPSQEEQRLILTRQHSLFRIGGDLQVAHSRDPYAPNTLEIRDPGDFSAARLLRAALDHADAGRYDKALVACQQAADLAPGYHEPHRVRGYVHYLSSNMHEAQAAFGQSVELASDSPYAHYFYGKFLTETGMNPREGLLRLQEAARLDRDSFIVQVAVAQAHQELGSWTEATDIVADLLTRVDANTELRPYAVYIGLRACVQVADRGEHKPDGSLTAEAAERAVTVVEAAHVDDLQPYLLDLCMLLEQWSGVAADESDDDFLARRCREFSTRLRERRRQADATHLGRKIGQVKRIVLDRGFGFVVADGHEYFLHESELDDPQQFYEIGEHSTVGFTPGSRGTGGRPPAYEVRWLA